MKKNSKRLMKKKTQKRREDKKTGEASVTKFVITYASPVFIEVLTKPLIKEIINFFFN